MANADAINISASGLINFTGTAFANNAVTNHAILLGNSTQGITNVGPGTAGQILVSGGASADPAYVTPISGAGTIVTANASTYKFELGGGWVQLSSQIATAQASLTFANLLTSPYQTFCMTCTNVTGAATTLLLMQLSNNAGVSYITTGYQSGAWRWGGSSSANSNSTAGLILVSTDATGPANGMVFLTNTRNGGFVTSTGLATRFGNLASAAQSWIFMGTYPTNITADSVQIVLANAGNFSGNFILYGFKEG